MTQSSARRLYIGIRHTVAVASNAAVAAVIPTAASSS
jgi:hypothetical protein